MQKVRLFDPFCFVFLSAETLVELVNTSARFNLLLLSGIERMTLRAYVKFQNVALLRRTSYERSATRAYCSHFMIIGMYIFLHFAFSSKLLAYAIIHLYELIVNRF